MPDLSQFMGGNMMMGAGFTGGAGAGAGGDVTGMTGMGGMSNWTANQAKWAS
jgi:hypothetical protein